MYEVHKKSYWESGMLMLRNIFLHCTLCLQCRSWDKMILGYQLHREEISQPFMHLQLLCYISFNSSQIAQSTLFKWARHLGQPRYHYRTAVLRDTRFSWSLMAKWLKQASQWHEMYCHDLEIMSSNPARVELGVRSTSVLNCTWIKHINFTYLEGVILVRSSPMVFITLLPHNHSPIEIPAPPYNKIQIGVAAFPWTTPVVPVSHRETRGPIALL